MLKLSQSRIITFTSASGLFAFSVIAIGAALSALFYSGRTGEPYSFFNHFISELGNKNYSGHAYFFNDALQLSGIPIMIFMTGICMLLQSRLRYALLVSGVLSGILCILLGIFSSDRFDIHIKVALGQFNMMLVSSVLFSAAVLRERDRGRFAHGLGYVGALPVVCIVSFLAVEYTHREEMKNGHIHHLLYVRPAFWPLPFLEWTVFFSLLVWVAMICSYLVLTQMKENSQAATTSS